MESWITISLWILTMLLGHLPADAQNSSNSICGGVSFNETINVNETEPPGTELLHISAPGGVKWSLDVNYDGLEPGVLSQRLLDPYLSLQPHTGGYYLLTLNKTLDLEELLTITNKNLPVISLKLECLQTAQSQATNYDAFIVIQPVNEYIPQFLDSPYEVDISEKQAKGFLLMTLQDQAFDLDWSNKGSDIREFGIADYHDSQVDGQEFFGMPNAQEGQIELTKMLDYEELARHNSTTLWLNVTVTDGSRQSNWTTVKVNVLDDDDLSPEFYHPATCAPQEATHPDLPCLFSYTASVLVNTTGPIKKIQPGAIYARDRDTFNSPVKYSLLDDPGGVKMTSHLNIDPMSGALSVVKPFHQTGTYSLFVEATEESQNRFNIRATLKIAVYAPGTGPFAQGSQSSSQRPSSPTGGAAAQKLGTGSNRGGAEDSTNSSPDDSKKDNGLVPMIGIIVLGVVVVIVLVILFLTCLKTRKQSKVGLQSESQPEETSVSPSDGKDLQESSLKKPPEVQDPEACVSPTALINQPEPEGDEPASADQATENQSNELNQHSNTTPTPTQPAKTDPHACNGLVFDGTKPFDSELGAEFFTAPGKTKVPLVPTRNLVLPDQPIIIDDGDVSS